MISRLIRKLQHRLSCIAGWTENMEEKKYKAIIEGILFSMGESVELEKIAGTLGLDQKKTKDLIDEMRNEWEEQKRGVTITELDGAYQMCTRPEIYEYLIKIAKQPKRRVLTDVLLETLSIIAYKQPVTKMEIEKIRGVSSDHAVNKLVELEDLMHRGVRYFSEQQKNFYAVSAYIQSMICRYLVRYRWKSLSRKQKKRCM